MLTNEEKQLLNEACNVYIQVAKQQITPEKVKDLATTIGKIFQKIDNGTISDETLSKPQGISDEWFKDVCKGCEQLNGTMCKDKVTEKFPGKCDPILNYERQKYLDSKKEEVIAVDKPQLKLYEPDGVEKEN